MCQFKAHEPSSHDLKLLEKMHDDWAKNAASANPDVSAGLTD